MSKSSAILSIFLAFVVVALIGLTGLRIARNYAAPSKQFDWENRGLSDFHNTHAYTLAFRDGVSPYSKRASEQYDMARPSPPYSPIVFVLNLPLTFLSMRAAEIVFCLCNLVMLGLLAWMAIRFSNARFQMVWFLAFVIMLLVSRPGHITLFTGYFSLEIILGTIIAIHYAQTRPVLSGGGMLLASIKPTYILPLLILMVCRRNYRAVAYGVLFCTIGGIIGFGWLASQSSLEQIATEFVDVQKYHHEDPTELPVNTWTRVDLVGMVAKCLNWAPGDKIYLLLMAGILIFPGMIVFRASPSESNSGATGLTAWIVLLSILLGIYHHSYDCLLVVVPWIGITFYGECLERDVPLSSRRWVALLVAVPAGNYLSTQSARHFLGLENTLIWQGITLINGVCLFIALLILMYHGWRLARDGSPSLVQRTAEQ